MKPPAKKERLKLRNMIDRWNLSIVFLFSFFKTLHFFRKLGMAAREGGWRRAMRAYSLTEHSKFSLAAFRLNFWSDLPAGEDRRLKDTKEHIINRLSDFLKKTPLCHWRLNWGFFSVKREKKEIIDIIHAEFNKSGGLDQIVPYLDLRHDRFPSLDIESKYSLNTQIVNVYNEVRNLPDKKRPWRLMRKLTKWILTQKHMHIKARQEAWYYMERILSGVFISFEMLPQGHTNADERRFRDPHFIRRKHPGFGLINILCRFSEHHDEADLWFQFHHVPVDGVPMQEVLNELKAEWGTRGPLIFPALSKQKESALELCSTDEGEKGMYHGRRFIDFRRFLAIRKELNARFGDQLPDEITAVSMLMWGLVHHEGFHNRKFLFTIDLPVCTLTQQERSPGLVFIRPSLYVDPTNPSEGFLRYQRELNRRLQATRERKSESHEFLELSALTSPPIYALTRRLMSKSLAEFTGTVGITVIRDADMFLTPLSDLHTDGFLAFGNFSIPTEDGAFCGAVSVRGPQEKIKGYLKAAEEVALDFYKYF